MNDCFWCWISDCCDTENCNKCNKYISVNTPKGIEMLEQRQKDVDEALIPVVAKWKEIFASCASEHRSAGLTDKDGVEILF